MSSRYEVDVGMTEYISKHAGFQGVIKMRYQDFIVNEIDEDGQVVHLTDITCDSLEHPGEEKTSDSQDCSRLSEDDKERLRLLVDGKDDIKEVMLNAGDSKQERTEIHKAIRWLYPELGSETVDNESDCKMIKVTKGNQDRRSRSQNNRSRMPRHTLCKFVLFKQNVGTMEAINSISGRLRQRNSHGFQYAGTKDKRAVTVQYVTAPFAAERLCGLNKLKDNIRVGNFSYCKKPLRLGDLGGNHFSVLIRNVKGSKDEISSAFDSFSNSGFINYFGMQRFGTTSVATYSVGVAILKSNWQKVVDLLLSPRNNEKEPDLNKCLIEYSTSGDADAALKCLRFQRSIEGDLLRGLSKYGKTQLLQAITTIPRNMRQMYVHSYQSYVWNRVVSKRIKDHGLKPIAGDLVFTKTYKSKLSEKESLDNDEEPPNKKFCPPENVVHDCTMKSQPHGPQEVETLTEEDTDYFSIQDILLPLPGHDVTYPANDLKAYYRDIMSSDGVNIDVDMIHRVKDYSLPGAYRYIVVRPTRVSYDTVNYNDYTIPLLQNDLERLKKEEMPSGVPDGKFLALRAQFSLPTSSYATVALREILKMDISVTAQMELNKDHGSVEDANDTSDRIPSLEVQQ